MLCCDIVLLHYEIHGGRHTLWLRMAGVRVRGGSGSCSTDSKFLAELAVLRGLLYELGIKMMVNFCLSL